MSGFDHNGLFFLSSYGLSSSPPTQTELIAFLNAKQHEILNRLPKSSASIGLVSDALDQKLQEYKDFLVGMSQNRILSHPFLSTQDRLKLVRWSNSLTYYVQEACRVRLSRALSFSLCPLTGKSKYLIHFCYGYPSARNE